MQPSPDVSRSLLRPHVIARAPHLHACCVLPHTLHQTLISPAQLLFQLSSPPHCRFWAVFFVGFYFCWHLGFGAASVVGMAKFDSKYAVYGAPPDLEAGYGNTPALYPGIAADENELRWGLIRKVYSILSIQVLLTAVVASFVVFTPAVLEFFAAHAWILFLTSFAPLIIMCPLYYYHQQHPVNLLLLGLFTVTISLSVGISCALTNGTIVLEALILTGLVVLGLTAYTHWAARKGHDFSFLGPMLFTSLWVVILFGFIQVFFPLGPLSQTIYGALTAVIFSGYIIYDTDNLIKRYSYDEYIWASVALYLDILNLFLSLLNILRSMQEN